MKKAKQINYDDIIMTNEEIGRTVNNHMEMMSNEEILDLFIRIFKESEEEEPGRLKAAEPIVKILYSGREMYSYGFLTAIYFMNESLKSFYEE